MKEKKFPYVWKLSSVFWIFHSYVIYHVYLLFKYYTYHVFMSMSVACYWYTLICRWFSFIFEYVYLVLPIFVFAKYIMCFSLFFNTMKQCVTLITGKSIRDEARACTTTFNLVRNIRRRRLKWLGKILRNGEDKLTYNAILDQHSMDRPVNLLMDAPPHSSVTEL